MKYDGIQARNQAANRFYQAAEEAGERSIRQAVRAIGDEIMNDHSGAFGPEKAEALERLGRSIGEYAQLGLAQVIRNYEERVQAILRMQAPDSKGGSKMGLFGKILGKKEKSAAPESTQQKMEIDIFDLEQQYEKYLDQYKKDHQKYEELARRAVGLDKNSFDYEIIAREARSCCKSMERHRSMMDQVYSVLETNRDAFEALAGGKTLAQLRQRMPDAAQVAVLMEGFADAVEEMRAQQEDISDAVRESSGRIFAEAPRQDAGADALFSAAVDRMTAEKAARETAEKQSREAAEARDQALAEEKQKAREEEQRKAAEARPACAVPEVGNEGAVAAE